MSKELSDRALAKFESERDVWQRSRIGYGRSRLAVASVRRFGTVSFKRTQNGPYRRRSALNYAVARNVFKACVIRSHVGAGEASGADAE